MAQNTRDLESTIEDIASDDLEVSLPSEKDQPFWMDYLSACGEYLGEKVRGAPRAAARALLYTVGGGLSAPVKHRIERRYGKDFFHAEKATFYNAVLFKPALYAGIAAATIPPEGLVGLPPAFAYAGAGVCAALVELFMRGIWGMMRNDSEFDTGDPYLGPVSWLGEKLHDGVSGAHRDIFARAERRRGK